MSLPHTFLTFSLRLIYYLRRRSSSSCSREGGTDLQLAKSCGLFGGWLGGFMGGGVKGGFSGWQGCCFCC